MAVIVLEWWVYEVGAAVSIVGEPRFGTVAASGGVIGKIVIAYSGEEEINDVRDGVQTYGYWGGSFQSSQPQISTISLDKTVSFSRSLSPNNANTNGSYDFMSCIQVDDDAYTKKASAEISLEDSGYLKVQTNRPIFDIGS